MSPLDNTSGVVAAADQPRRYHPTPLEDRIRTARQLVSNFAEAASGLVAALSALSSLGSNIAYGLGELQKDVAKAERTVGELIAEHAEQDALDAAEEQRRAAASVIIWGPQGSGKTKNAAAIARHYGKVLIVDDYEGGNLLSGLSLALTTSWMPGAIFIGDACRAAGIEWIYPKEYADTGSKVVPIATKKKGAAR